MGEIIKRENIRQVVKGLQDSGKTVVTTNGCFDILHVGHVRYLQKTKTYADYSVVLLNSDKSVKSIKGDFIRDFLFIIHYLFELLRKDDSEINKIFWSWLK